MFKNQFSFSHLFSLFFHFPSNSDHLLSFFFVFRFYNNVFCCWSLLISYTLIYFSIFRKVFCYYFTKKHKTKQRKHYIKLNEFLFFRSYIFKFFFFFLNFYYLKKHNYNYKGTKKGNTKFMCCDFLLRKI